MKFLSIATDDSREPGELDSQIGVKLTRDGPYLVGITSKYEAWANLIPSIDAQSLTIKARARKVYVLSWDLATDLNGAGKDNLFGTVDDEQINDNLFQSDSINLDITFSLN